MDEPSSHQRYFLPEISHSVIENETNQGSVFGPQHQKQQNDDVLKGTATSECTEIGSYQASDLDLSIRSLKITKICEQTSCRIYHLLRHHRPLRNLITK